ncbi:hypothetical protein HDU79_007939 [Rhizoclosmatium sp. JEL0117]|nr:hypothetical protein HDU79_007939 [Rhizoclosmatium sp. JEL0117]
MNSTTGTLTFEEEQNLLIGLGTIGIITTISAFIYHVTYVLHIETYLKDGTYKLKKLWQPFNLNLLVMAISMLGYYVTFIIGLEFPNDTNLQILLLAINDFLIATTEYCYIRYSASRGLSIITRAYPGIATTLKYFLKVVPFLLYAQVFPATIDAALRVSGREGVGAVADVMSIAEQVFSCVAASATFFFDSVFMAGFSRFIFGIQNELKEEMDPTFLVIAKFGMLSSMAIFMALGFYVAVLAAGVTGFWYNVGIWCSYFMTTVVLGLLIGMKLAVRIVTHSVTGGGSYPSKQATVGMAKSTVSGTVGKTKNGSALSVVCQNSSRNSQLPSAVGTSTGQPSGMTLKPGY